MMSDGAGPLQVIVIVNPNAKKGRAPQIAQKIVRLWNRWGWRCELKVPKTPQELGDEAHRAVERSPDAVFVVGGDGTVHHALPALSFSPVPLGILPCGRGNDLVRALGLPTEPSRMAGALRSFSVRNIDVGSINGRLFCGIVTCGLDSDVADFAHRHRHIPGGWLGYFSAALFLLARFRFPTVSVCADGWHFEGPVTVCATANCPAYGGGLWIAPTAQLDDGLLNVCLVRKTSKVRILCLLPTLFWGGHINEPEVTILPAERVSLSSPSPLPLFADGEPVGVTPAEITIHRSALRVVTPRAGDK